VRGSHAQNVLIVGQGSIGLRHRDVLQSLGAGTFAVSRRPGLGNFDSIEAALAASRIDVAVIATETARHAADLAELARLGFKGPVVVEKPVVAWPEDLSAERPAGPIFAGYNLRFLPVVGELRAAIAADGSDCVAAQLHVGQALAAWRPGRDNASVYSAHREQGGGALRDLSHELDLALWLFGRMQRLAATGGRYSEQTVDADDAWSILAACERCPQVSITMNAIDDTPSRFISVTTLQHRYHADLLTGTLIAGRHETRHESAGDDSYRRMWQAVLTDENADMLCDWGGGAAVMNVIEAAEAASEKQTWIVLER
jgi:predicted dehydrogenase